MIGYDRDEGITGFLFGVLMIVLICAAAYGVSERRDGKLSEERESIVEIMVGERYDTENVILLKELEDAEAVDDVVAVARENYDTEDVILLTELYDEENYSKYELLVEGGIKQAIYIKDTSEVVLIE